MRANRLALYTLLAAFLFATVVVVISFIPIISVRDSTEVKFFDRVDDVPYRRVGLLLGTSKYTRGGLINLYYLARLRAAVDLYTHGRIDVILASGDNQFAAYNEPREMRDALLQMGVADEDIILDYAGFRTFDSVVRISSVFGIREYTVITQYPHSLRALYIAKQFDHSAIAYHADLPRRGLEVRFRLREVLARVKAVLDIHVLGTRPRYLGSATQPAL